jgi:hypothetical protein
MNRPGTLHKQHFEVNPDIASENIGLAPQADNTQGRQRGSARWRRPYALFICAEQTPLYILGPLAGLASNIDPEHQVLPTPMQSH